MWKRLWTRTFGSDEPFHQQGEWLCWAIAGCGWWLFLATRALWINRGDFPQVPWFDWCREVPRVVDSGLLLVLAVGLSGVGYANAGSRANRWCLLAFAGGLSGLMVLDQHRCQPWAYQLVLISLILAWSPLRLAIRLLRVLTTGIYVHSAFSKLDWTFCHGLGRSFWLALQGLFTGGQAINEEGVSSLWPLIFPVGELLIAIGLVFPTTRRWALWGSAAMHLGLLLILGPLGLNHSIGVLVWNLFFGLQNLVVFAGTKTTLVSQTDGAAVSTSNNGTSHMAVALTVWAVVWPIGEPWGYCDLWPAWGLYAQHGELLIVAVQESALRRLPPAWQNSAVGIPDDGLKVNYWRLRPQQVALQATAAPVYPQNRFLLGVTLATARNSQIPSEQISGTWYTRANRWTGDRRTIELKNLDEIEQAADNCRWNAKPRN